MRKPAGCNQRRRTQRVGFWALLAVFASIATTAAIVVLILVSLSQSRTTREALHRSFEARSQIQRVFSLLQDAETGQRGFVITGNDSFLEPYHRSVTELEHEMATLRTLFGNEQEQMRLLQQLEGATAQKLAELERVINATRAQGREAGRAAVSEGRGKALMDRIRVITGDMTVLEAMTLETRLAENAWVRQFLQVVIFGVLAIVVVVTCVSAWFVFNTLRRRLTTELSLRESLARQNAIFDGTIEGMVILNESGSVEAPNSAAETLFGYGRGRMMGMDFGKLVDLDGQDEVGTAAKLKKLFRLGERQEVMARSYDGSMFPAEVGLTELLVEERRLYVAAVRDISERKRVEQLKNEFVSTVSHELRTPLTSISGSLGLVMGGAAGAVPDKAARLLDIAHKNSLRLIRLINDILDIEKIESGKMVFDLKPTNLKMLAEQAIEANRGYADGFNVTIALSPDARDEHVNVDADRMAQVITNLLSNAIKFSPAAAEVGVDIREHEGNVRLSVQDRGPGIPEQFRESIFSKFAQADASDAKAKGGTGLGLSIVRDIVVRLGGVISFETTEGQGTTFHVDLPRCGAAQAVEPARRQVLIHGTDVAVTPTLRNLLRDQGIAVEVAADEQSARAMIAGRRFDVALIDVVAHIDDGIGLIKAIRADAINSNLPILIFAGGDEVLDAGWAALNVLDWLEKPDTPEDMVAVIRDALTRAEAIRPRVLHVDDDPDVLQVVSNALAHQAEITSVGTLRAARESLARQGFDIVILDLSLGDTSGLDLLPDLRDHDGEDIPVIVFSAHDSNAAVAAQVSMMLTKSRASIDHLVSSVYRLARRRVPTPARSLA